MAEGFVRSVTGMGAAVRASFDTNVGSITGTTMSGSCGTLAPVALASAPFDAVVVEENLVAGQIVLGYTLETQEPTTKVWAEVPLDRSVAGQTVGSRAIVVLPGGLSNASAVRFRCTNAIGGNSSAVTLTRFSLHRLVQPPVVAKHVSLRSYWSLAGNDTAPCAMRDGSRCTT